MLLRKYTIQVSSDQPVNYVSKYTEASWLPGDLIYYYMSLHTLFFFV